jgi:hypothetical protein
MVGRGTVAIGAAGAVLFASAAPAAATHQYNDTVHCGDKTVHHVELVKESSRAIVFRKHRSSPSGQISVAYACLRDSSALRPLKRSAFTRSAIDPRLAGHFVAFREIIEQSEVGSRHAIVVLNVKTGKIKVEEDAMPSRDASLQAFVVKGNGSVAWVGLAESGDEAVWKVDSTTVGEPQRLDQGPSNIPQQSLRLSKNRQRVLWIKHGHKHSAPID